MKIITGHQPVYLPWLGLIHKASLADQFVYMDDVQYLQQDWNNRNKIKSSSGEGIWLSVPVDLKNSASHELKDILIKEENIAPHKGWAARHWTSLQSSYGKTPYFKDYKDFFEDLYMQKKWNSLSELNLYILKKVFEWFSIDTEILIASSLNFQNKKSDLILEHARKLEAELVVTGTHGKDYIRLEDFEAENIKIYFQDYKHPVYPQRFGEFVSHLSFVDLLFNCGPQSREICLSSNITRKDLENEV